MNAFDRGITDHALTAVLDGASDAEKHVRATHLMKEMVEHLEAIQNSIGLRLRALHA